MRLNSKLTVAAAMAAGLIAATAYAAAPPAKSAAPAQPVVPAPVVGPNNFVLTHALKNATEKLIEYSITMDGAQVAKGRLLPAKEEDGASSNAVVDLAVPQQTTSFWEISYVEPEKKKHCRQAWTAILAPGTDKPTLIAPPQQVNKSGTCDFTIEVTDGDSYTVGVQLVIPPS